MQTKDLHPETDNKCTQVLSPNNTSSNYAPDDVNKEPEITLAHENTPTSSQGSDSAGENEIPRKIKKNMQNH